MLDDFKKCLFNQEEEEAYQVILNANKCDSFDQLAEKFMNILGNKINDIEDSDDLFNEDTLYDIIRRFDVDQDRFLNNRDLPILQTYFKMLRYILIEYVNKYFGIEKTLALIEAIEKSQLKIYTIEGIDHSKVVNNLDQLKKNLVEYVNRNKFHYWSRSRQNLELLYELLLEQSYIEENPYFEECFKHKDPDPALKTKWIGDQTDLVFMAYRLWNTIFDKKFHVIAFKIFYIHDGKYTPHHLSKTYQNIRHECENNDDVLPKRKKLLNIINEVMKTG